jgi:hypothetical protein
VIPLHPKSCSKRKKKKEMNKYNIIAPTVVKKGKARGKRMGLQFHPWPKVVANARIKTTQ